MLFLKVMKFGAIVMFFIKYKNTLTQIFLCIFKVGGRVFIFCGKPREALALVAGQNERERWTLIHA